MKDLDEALERFQLCDLEYGAGLPNYGPMAAEALVELGHDALVTGLIDVYAPRLPPRPGGRALSESERVEALGLADRRGDWIATYESRLHDAPWREVVADEAGRLVPGVGKDAVHGLIRLAHALLALERGETPARVAELAFGLAQLACHFEAAAAAGSASGAGGEVDLPSEIGRQCGEGARRYLANPEARSEHTIGVMGPAALRVLLPWIDAEAARRALTALEALREPVAMVAAQARKIESVDDVEVERCAGSVEEVRYRAACSLQEHAIPFAEACLREDAITPSHELRRAAADAALRLSPVGYQEWR